MSLRPFVAVWLCLSFVAIASAQLPMPKLRSVYPPGARQGTSVEAVVEGDGLDEPSRLYFSHPGLKSEKLEPQKNEKGRFRVSVAKDVAPGYYDVRVVGKLGVSNPRTFVVGDRAESLEVEPNDESAVAQRVPLESVVNGQMQKSEDVDWFVFPGKKGQRVFVECTAWRIDSKFDGYLFLHGPDGRELAASQDESIRDQMRDPFIDVVLPADGDYALKLVDFMYAGGSDYYYRLSIGTAPYLDFIAPSGLRPGEKRKITLYGRGLPGGKPAGIEVNGKPLESVVVEVAAPRDPAEVDALKTADLIRPQASQISGFEIHAPGPTGISNPKLVVFSEAEETLEQEPNDDAEHAQRLTLPAAVSGQFLTNDLDFYAFAAQKGKKYAIEVISQRLGSPADPDLEILNEKGDLVQALADDNQNIGQIRFYTNGRDIRGLFTATKDGEFKLRLEHLYRAVQGGPQYTYRLVVRADPVPDFALVCQPPHEVHRDSHLVLQGGRARVDILAWRLDGHVGPIDVEVLGLPKGVTADPIVLGPGVNWGTLVLTAAADAELTESDIRIVGRSEVEGVKREHAARGGVVVWDTVNTPAISRQTQSIVLAVREGAPFELKATVAGATLEVGKPIELTVDVRRHGTMKNAVQLVGAGYQLPPRMEIPTTNIAPDKSQAKVSIDTAKMAPGTYSFLINGDAQVPVAQPTGPAKNVRCVYPSNTVTVTITPSTAVVDPAKKK
ncbi:MAG: hypothetical protein K8U03_16545 [Planctomycetia bacterium]|nr:hypothetical protein [Planctomycetia bacterium]